MKFRDDPVITHHSKHIELRKQRRISVLTYSTCLFPLPAAFFGYNIELMFLSQLSSVTTIWSIFALLLSLEFLPNHLVNSVIV